MASETSPMLNLAVPVQSDPFSTLEIKNNWNKIDAAPGVHICTSTTRPTWTLAQKGRTILETNTGLEWRWDGAAFQRMHASGLLKTTTGTWAIGERTTDFSTQAENYVRAVTVASVVVPAGNRPIRMDLNWFRTAAADGNFYAAIFRSATNDSGPIQDHWVMPGNAGDNTPGGGTYFSIERDGLPAGTYSFSFQIKRIATRTGDVTIEADTTTPIRLTISEM